MVYIACMGMGIIYAVMPFVTDLTIVMVMGVGTNASCISFAHIHECRRTLYWLLTPVVTFRSA